MPAYLGYIYGEKRKHKEIKIKQMFQCSSQEKKGRTHLKQAPHLFYYNL